MSHRSGRTSRRDPAPDVRLLVLGVVLVAVAIAMALCEPLYDALSSPALTGPAPQQHGGARP